MSHRPFKQRLYPQFARVGQALASEKRLELPDLKAVFTTAEMLQPQYRKSIENHLKVAVFDHLGCNDGGFLSYECNLH
ncbi:MAG: hypothetical protein IH822_07990, partial [Chloroflexi bacterium]|nr:hypothetical protein [Chloroflexota bacterium]